MSFLRPRILNSADYLKDFDCGEPVLNQWLKNHGLQNNKLNGTLTFVIENDNGQIAAFYSLVMAEVQPEHVSAKLKSGMGKYPIPVIKLTRMGVDLRFQKLGLGQGIIRELFKKSLELSHEIGFKAIVVDPLNENARSFYKSVHFKENNFGKPFMYITVPEIAAALK